ncbi:MAG TPA: LysR family transcriptional regulator [Burkholderiales bacterium]|nr:LysR family transcriptional regulator [Burkholderiales bacterium]
MKSSLKSGISTQRTFTVDRDSTIGFMGEDARVYATPMLVRDIEITCRDFLLQHLDPGEDSVGIRVEIDHLAATLLGMKVEIAVTIGELKGRAVIFDVVATDGVDTICRGRHSRFVANVAQVKARLAEKQKKAA